MTIDDDIQRSSKGSGRGGDTLLRTGYVSAKFESTCKQWHRLFNGDSRFAREHNDKAAKQFLVLLVDENRICPAIFNLLHGSVEFKTKLSLVDSHSMYSAQFDISRAFHCDGLLLCTSADSCRFVVWNPFTDETSWFQPNVRDRDFVLGYYQKDNDKRYKILSYSRDRKDYNIYEFNSGSWRTLDDIIAPIWSIEYAYLSVSLKGNAYGFATTYGTTKAQRNISLLKFDFQTEKSVLMPLPYQCPYFESTCLSVVREEKLSVLLHSDYTSKAEIWVTNKIDETIQVVSWNKVLALDLSPGHQICDGVNFLLDEEKKVVMMCVRRWCDETKAKNMIYIVGKDGDEVTQVEIGSSYLGTDYQRQTSILNYVPSLVQIEQARRKKKRGNYTNM